MICISAKIKDASVGDECRAGFLPAKRPSLRPSRTATEIPSSRVQAVSGPGLWSLIPGDLSSTDLAGQAGRIVGVVDAHRAWQPGPEHTTVCPGTPVRELGRVRRPPIRGGVGVTARQRRRAGQGSLPLG
jgi:hypothetical protein